MIVDYEINGEKKHYAVTEILKKQLDTMSKLINEDDMDFVLVVDGQERAGKSVLASQCAYYVDKSFNEDRMCFTPEEFREKVSKAKKGQAVVFDESFIGLGSRYALSEVNKMMISMMMEMGKKNLFIILVIPSVFYLEKYVALHRARGLLHVYLKRGKRGQFLIYNQKRLKQLYLLGKRTMSYSRPRLLIPPQNFGKKAPFDWEAYEDRKLEALKHRHIGKIADKQMLQRDLALWMLKKVNQYTDQEITDEFKLWEVNLPRKTLNDSIHRINQYKENNGIKAGV